MSINVSFVGKSFFDLKTKEILFAIKRSEQQESDRFTHALASL